ncbi:hypothetical protein SAMD00019534_080360 [Acytostelium subglobosum LB1]|uniref:hypothetical protein n=1 Tax=Acytostelium subglobosum LB1 TaxID=1410327 RepID=UPI0006448857|nr:hypothetical protein SAMD00019534_080360 [Acytostelium subglobosum LB1]GAM24861.1 hypothetical protein SAMD00019534_080360 [Acytostelium subglobosum LB1]|eukprot:XP_012751950.1 hypothetical protein SAMD00019534_080360 [Acytostelium subglobosum LB1]
MSLDMVHEPTFSMQHLPLVKLSIKLTKESQLQVLSGLLPRTLSKLDINGEFDSSLAGLPESLGTLTINANWHHRITPGMLPPNLTELHLVSGYPQSILKDALPSKLACIDMGRSFNQPIDNLPPSVTELYLGHNYDLPLHYLPVQSLYHYGKASFFPGQSFPTITSMCLCQDLNTILSITESMFPNLDSLILFDLEVDDWDSLDLSTMPSSLRLLDIQAHGPISSLPKGLKHLNTHCYSGMFDKIDVLLPPSLEFLHLHSYQHPISIGDLPQSLTSLSLIDMFYSLHPTVIPPSVRTLSINSFKRGELFEHLDLLLAMTSLFEIKLRRHRDNYTASFELLRISDTLFLNHTAMLPSYGFIDAATILAKTK